MGISLVDQSGILYTGPEVGVLGAWCVYKKEGSKRTRIFSQIICVSVVSHLSTSLSHRMD